MFVLTDRNRRSRGVNTQCRSELVTRRNPTASTLKLDCKWPISAVNGKPKFGYWLYWGDEGLAYIMGENRFPPVSRMSRREGRKF